MGFSFLVLSLDIIGAYSRNCPVAGHSRARVHTAKAASKAEILITESRIHKRISKLAGPVLPKDINPIQHKILLDSRHTQIPIDGLQVIAKLAATDQIDSDPSTLLYSDRTATTVTVIVMFVDGYLYGWDQVAEGGQHLG